ncbi:hypothetical protein L3081_00165 [Colwellia sp. MSW7]|uniref:Uncharacterized protein n=1 Tax=Colwellia maritima TaxID=2912588 RepID=A0ABS9WWC8_9GAMM|nr:hypothetical protein [Colwellia maritima]MCI2282099.1 hypothetical protein [Colwellia maritima]
MSGRPVLPPKSSSATQALLAIDTLSASALVTILNSLLELPLAKTIGVTPDLYSQVTIPP